MPLISEGFNAAKLAKSLKPRYPASKLDWPNSVLSTIGTDRGKFDKFVRDQLGEQLIYSNIQSATLKNSSPSGLDIRFGSLTSTNWGARELSAYDFLRIGPIAIPKTIEIQLSAKLWSGALESFFICAGIANKRYTLFSASKENLLDILSTDGVRCNNNAKRLMSWTNSSGEQHYYGTLNVADMTQCFTAGEEYCELSIIRLASGWPPLGTTKLTDMSQLVLKSLKIT